MPQQSPLHPGDPRRIGRYRVGGRIIGIPSDDPIFIGLAPDGSEVAISLIQGDWAKDGAARDRFAAEAAVAKRVPPFCAARVLDAGLDATGAFLVSEYVPGPSLLELVVADGVQRAYELEAIAIGMATGLASVHQAGLVHGNFGPEYVVMADAGPLRVIEFGITPPYGTATPSADMLAWAETVIFAAAGRPPATLDDVDLLPEPLREPVDMCLGSVASERPAARAVIQILLGNEAPAAGLLAEGSRRAVRPRAGYGASGLRTRSAGDLPDRYLADRRAPDRRDTDRRAPDRRDTDRRDADRQAIEGIPGSRLAVPRQRSGHFDRPDDGRDRPSGTRHLPAIEAASTPRRTPARSGRPPARRSGRRNRTAWLTGGTFVVLVVIGVVILYLAQSSGGAPPAGNNQDGPSSPSQSSSGSPSQTPVLPKAFAGTWAGSIRQAQQTETVDISLQTGQQWSISYTGPDLNCTGVLTLTTATSTQVTLSQGIVTGQRTCVNGPVTLTMTSTGRLTFAFNGTSLPGTLRQT